MACEINVPLVEQAIGKTALYNELVSKFGKTPDLIACFKRIFDFKTIKIEENKNKDIDINTISSKSADFGVIIDRKLKQNWATWQQYNPDGIVAYRVNFDEYNTPSEALAGRIGNPFSEGKGQLNKGQDTVQKFYEWLVTGNNFGEEKATEEYRQAIIKRILNSPDNTKILYYTELNRPSHATVIGYLIKNKDKLINNNQNTTITIKFSEPFKESYKKQFGVEIPSVTTDNIFEINNIIEAAKVYNSGQNPNGNNTVLETDYSDLAEGYTNGVTTRNKGIKIAQGLLFDSYFYFRYKYSSSDLISRYGINSYHKATKEMYETETVGAFIDELIKIINTGRENGITSAKIAARVNYNTIKKYSEYYKNQGISSLCATGLAVQQARFEVIKSFLPKENLNSNVSNIIAAINEMLNFDTVDINSEEIRVRDDYFNRVWNSSVLSQLYIKDNNDRGDEAYQLDEDEFINAQLTTDLTFRDYEDRLGVDYSTYKLHLSPEINLYLKHINDIESRTKNDFGLPIKMDSSKISALLYSAVDNTNLDSMIESIGRLADKIPGFKGLNRLYSDLKSNRDLAAKFFVNFAKYKMPSLQVMLNGDVIELDTTESDINRFDALKFKYYSDFRRKAINSNFELIKPKLKELDNAIIAFNKNQSKENKEDVIKKLTNLFKEYIPSIDYANIANYISKEDYSEINNINSLQRSIEELSRKANDFKEVFNSDPEAILNNDLLSHPKVQAISVLTELAKKLIPYSNPYIQLTVSNVLGKNHSAVQNNNFLTRFMEQLKSDLNNNEKGLDTPLLSYANYLFQSNQYKFSNILLEHKDTDGSIINKGLFRRNDDNTLEYTEYAKDLLDLIDFDGIYNAFGDAVTYVKTSKADYILSGYEIFFKDRNKVVDDTELVPYLLKTPSDASHNYAIYAPVYKVNSLIAKNSLFTYDNELLNKRVSELLNKVTIIDKNDKKVSSKTMEIDYDDFITSFQSGSFDIYSINKAAIRWSTYEDTENNKKVTRSAQYLNLTVNDGKTELHVIVKGTYNEKENNFTIFDDIKNVGIVKEANKDVKTLAENSIRKDIITHRHITIDGTNWLQRSINKNHVIFKQFKNAFKQEMQNAADALILITDTDNGRITIDDVNKDTSILYKNYHYIDGVVIKDGKLTGKVFSSDRFTLKDKNGNEVNYMTKVFEVDGKVYQVLDTSENSRNPYSINFLYGGTNTNSHLHITNGEIEFTAEQEEAIDYAITQYIQDYIQYTKERLMNYDDSIHETSMTSDDNIAEYALNYRLFYINTCDLFDGDSKFYKNSQDCFKRLKEVQAGGISYSIFDIARKRLNDGAKKELINNAYLNQDSVQKRLNSLIPKGEKYDFRQYTTFVGATIRNRIKTNTKEINIIKKRLADAIYNSGDFSKEESAKRAANIMKGYEDITTDDAQSYITLEEFVRRLAAKGQLEDNMLLIEKLLNPDSSISDKDLNTFVQIQKNFYYDLHYDAKARVVAPRQIKNAEFVLIPRFIKGTQLESLYNAMKKAGVDQLNTEETSKAGKSQVVEVWTKNDTLKKQEGDLAKDLQNASQHFDYNHLFTQQENPQHMDDVNKAGVQIVKKIIDNIEDVDLNDSSISEYKKKLYTAKKNFLDNFSKNIKDSFNNLMTELIDDVEKDLKDGHLVIENEKVQGVKYIELLNRLRDELLRVNADSNSLDYVTLIDNAFETVSKQGNFVGLITKMPTIFPSIKNRLESAAQAVFTNAITRQTLPGFHAAQVTSVGFAKINTNKRLNYHISEDGFVHHIQVMVPASAFGLSFDNPRYDKFKTIEEKKAAMLKDIQEAGLDKFIGYRIPTEGKQSICLMEVVDILDPTQGSSIVVPDGWVAQTGSDFDDDSIYTIMFEHIINEFGKIKKYNNENEDRRTRNNNIIQSLIDILNNPLTIEEGLSQSKTTDVTNAMNKLFSNSYVRKEKDSRSTFDVLDQAEYQSEGLQGKDLKAISVNRDGFNSICNVAKPTLNKPITIVYEGNEVKYKLAKRTFGEENVTKIDNNHFKVKHTTWGWSKNNRNIEGDLLLPYSSETTAHMLDAVKIGHIPNVNKETFKVYKTLLDIGSNYDTALAFIVQPIISRFIEKLNRKNSIFSNDLTSPIKQTYIDIARSLNLDTKGTKEDIKDRIREALQQELNEINETILDYEILKHRFDTNTPLEESDNIEKAIDFLILEQYEYIDEIASEAENYANVLRSDKFGATASLFNNKKVFRDIEDIINSEESLFTVNGKNLLEAVYPGIEEGFQSYIQQNRDDESVYPPLHYFLKYGTGSALAINRLLFPTEQTDFDYLINDLSSVLNVKNISEELYNTYSNYILQHIFNKINTINLPLVYNKEINAFVLPDVKDSKDREKLVEYEKQRIFGYRHIVDSNINPNSFIPKDINNPTVEEIKEFLKFSPAEKVDWINEHFEDSLVGKYLTTRTIITTKYNEKYQACQTIKFNEDNIGLETVFEEFEKTFNNKNPFLAITAIDLVKYAFVVEGYQTRRHSINRIIKNSILINDNNNYGLNIIEDLKREFGNFVASIDSGVSDELKEKFIRSHTNIKEVPKVRLNKNKYKTFITQNTITYKDNDGNEINSGVIKLINNDVNAEFLKDIKDYTVIQAFIDKKFQSVLYKSEVINDVTYLYPLNKLQNNESGDVSWNENNDKYQNPSYYISVIDNDLYEDSPIAVREEKIDSENRVNLDINEPDVQNLLEVLSNTNEQYSLYKVERSNYIARSIKSLEQRASIIEPITQEEFIIRRAKTNSIYHILNKEEIKLIQSKAKSLYEANKYYGETKESAIKQAIKEHKIYKRAISKLKPYAEQAVINTLNAWTDDNLNFKSNFEDNYQISKNPFGELFAIERNNTKHATREESLVFSSKAIMRKARVSDDPTYQKMAQVMRDSGVNLHENDLNTPDDVKAKKTVETHLEDVASINSILVKKVVDEIENKLKNFTKIDDEWVKITDPRVFALLKTNPQLHAEYLTLLLDAQELIDNYTDETYDFRKITGDNNNSFVKENIEQINSDIARLINSQELAEAEKKYVEEYLSKLSNNPNVREGITSLFDSYHATSWFTANINDFGDTHNPALQVIKTTVMQNIYGADLQAQDAVRKFKEEWKSIINRAKAAGRPINFKNIIDESGRFIQEYNKEFESDLKDFIDKNNKLYESFQSADEDYINNPTPENKYIRYKRYKDYTEQQFKYRRWKLKNVNQEIKDEYLNKKLELEEEFFASYPNIYCEYKILEQKRNALYKETDLNVENENTKKLEEIEKAIHALTSPYEFKDGQWQQKELFEDVYANEEEKHEALLMDSESAEQLNILLKELRFVNYKIYAREERDDFRKNVENNLKIISEAESPKFDAEGKPYIPSQQTLLKDEEYRKAKLWLYRNATYFYGNLFGTETYTKEEYDNVLEKVFNENLKMDFAEKIAANPDMSKDEKEALIKEYNLRVRAALRVFRQYNNKGKDITPQKIYRSLANLRKAYDEYGVINGTKFTDSDIASIRKEMADKFSRKEDSILSQKTIIHYVPSAEESVVYTRDFYAGMTTEGMQNQDWEPIVRELNSYLIHGINKNGQFDASLLSYEDLTKIIEILENHFGFDRTEREFAYQNAVKKKLNVPKDSRKEVSKFIKENVDFVVNQEAYDAAEAKIQHMDDAYKRLWYAIFNEYDRSLDESGNVKGYVPNHLFFGYAKPKESTGDKFIDKKKTAALRILDKAFESNLTKYYYEAREEAIAKGNYKEWFENNHVFNPYKNRFEALPIWMYSTPVFNEVPGEWSPSYNQTITTISDEARNKRYKEGLSLKANFKTKSQVEEIKANQPEKIFEEDEDVDVNKFVHDSKYLNRSVNPTQEELELKDLMYKTLSGLAKNKKSIRYINEGWLPSRAKSNSDSITNPMFWANEFLKGLGFISGYRGNEDWQEYVDYGNDYIPDMPMLHLLKSVDSTKKSDIPKMPERLDGETIDDYNKRVKEYKDKIDEQKEHDLKIHQDLLDNNWESVFEEFIKKATHYNAVQDNKLMLYFGQKLINDFGTFESKRKKEGFGKYLSRRSGTYKKTVDTKLQEQYANWIRRVVFDQFKNPQGWRTKALQIMQSLTSTNYMTLNIRAGVSNVTVGESNIIAEAFAREHFDGKSWINSGKVYSRGIADYMSNMWKETSNTKVGAVIKGMNVIDFIELTGQVRELSPEEFSKRLRDLAFGPLSAGEHYMQNRGMIAMMLSHRVVKDRDGEYKIMSKKDYNRSLENEVFLGMATEEEKTAYNKKKEDIQNDPNIRKDYAQFRKNLVTEFVIKFSKERQIEFGKKLNDLIKLREGEFETNPTVWDQLDIHKDGKMTFAEGSILKALNDQYLEDKANNKTNLTLSPAYELLGRFKGKVIDVNKKIHGWYDKYSAAKIESGLLGGLIMQYHKHIVPGFLKRYRIEGYFNESTEAVEKGYYTSLFDFLKLNFENVKDHRLSNEQKTFLTGLQNFFGFILDYVGYVTTTYNILPEYEKANIRRNLGDLAAQVAAMLTGLLVLLGFDDDDDDDLLPNFSLYQADRLSSESWMWNPFGLVPEAKKLYSNPIAFTSIPSDILNGLEVICGVMFGGEDYDPRFPTGRYAGRNKIGVYFERRVPYWRNIKAIVDISENNRYYKLGGNPLGLVLKLKDKLRN